MRDRFCVAFRSPPLNYFEFAERLIDPITFGASHPEVSETSGFGEFGDLRLSIR